MSKLQLFQTPRSYLNAADGATDLSANPAYAIQATHAGACTLTVADALDDGEGSGAITNILAGQFIYGKFTSVTVTGGVAIVFKQGHE